MPEIIDTVFAKTSPKHSFPMTENERFGLVFANTGSINSGTGLVWVRIRSYLGFVWASFRVFRVYWSPFTVVNIIKVESHQITLHRW